MKSKKFTKSLQLTLCGICLSVVCFASGCQITVGGQLLPSPNYLTDDLQYFPPGPEFKLQNEANALEAYRAEQAIGEE
ncbi:MAG: hypothetical protein VX768_12170 [Planctomycetota bacterium]|nr:hypothetical protein [Planctomycetota bacterium]